MPRTIVLDTVRLRGITVIRQDDGTLKVEASYDVKAGGTSILSKTQDITKLVPAATLATIRATLTALETRIAVTETA